MRVLHILNSIERSGAEVMLSQAAPLFRERGMELHALAVGDSVGEYAPTLVKAGFVVHHLRFAPSVAFLARFWRLLRQGDFEVVHVHTERASFWYELVARLVAGRRVIRSVHSVFDFKGRLRVERWVQRRVATTLLGVRSVAPSPSVQEAEERIYGVRPVLIPNWTDTARFVPSSRPEQRVDARAALGVAPDAIVYVSVGSCQPVKNHAEILQAFARAAATRPRALYLHVGSGNLEAREQQLARDLGLTERVVFAGQRDDIPQVLQAGDVFVMPSLREGFGVACLEAMSCGLPAIVADVPGLRDLVLDGETGLLVHGDDGLEEAIAELYDDKKTRADMGKAGRARVLERFSVEKAVESFVGLYRPA